MITVFTEGSPPNKESAEPRLAQAIGDDYVNRRARSDITEVVYPTKQGVCQAEQAQATADDYATGEGNEKSHEHTIEIRTPKVRMTMVCSL